MAERRNPYSVPITEHPNRDEIEDEIATVSGNMANTAGTLDETLEKFAEQTLGDVRLDIEIERRRLRAALAGLDRLTALVDEGYEYGPVKSMILWDYSDEARKVRAAFAAEKEEPCNGGGAAQGTDFPLKRCFDGIPASL